ncbi:MAG: hypothetical protein WCI80_05435 [Bacteroidota bacterium]
MSEVQQAREMGELTASVKNTNTILERMENKLDSAIETVGTHSNTIALLTRVSSENSGMIKDIQDRLNGKNGRKGLVTIVDEIRIYKEAQCSYQEENRKGLKSAIFKIISYILTAIVAGWLVTKGLLNKL